MKKQILSVFILISVSFQPMYPLVEPTQKKNVVPWWRFIAVFKSFHAAEKALDQCINIHCQKEEKEHSETFLAQYDEWLKKQGRSGGIISKHKFFNSDAYRALPLEVCQRKYCLKEFEQYEKQGQEYLKSYLAVGIAQTLGYIGLLYFTPKVIENYMASPAGAVAPPSSAGSTPSAG